VLPRAHARASRGRSAALFESGAADGFNVMPPVFPSGLERFVDHVVPILQKRGLSRADYEGTSTAAWARPDNANQARARRSGAG
jgi:hypothetical protein